MQAESKAGMGVSLDITDLCLRNSRETSTNRVERSKIKQESFIDARFEDWNARHESSELRRFCPDAQATLFEFEI